MTSGHSRGGGGISTLFIDNGGHSIKAVYLRPSHEPQFLVIPNCVGAAAHIGRGIVGRQITQLPHYHGFMLRRPVDCGFIVDVAVQACIWEYVLQHFHIEDEKRVELWLTVPFGATKECAMALYELLTRRFKFQNAVFVSSTLLTLLSYENEGQHQENVNPLSSSSSSQQQPTRKRSRAEESSNDSTAKGTCLVVDVGFSATTVVPYISYMPVYSSIVRVDIGGKLLSNRLKEHLSFTQTNVMEDGWLVEHIKERCCEVVVHPRRVLDRLKKCVKSFGKINNNNNNPSTVVGEVVYYLPASPATQPLGCLEAELLLKLRITTAADSSEAASAVSELPHLRLRQERFLIPELLFTPGDVGLGQMGLSTAIPAACQRGLLAHLDGLSAVLQRRVYVAGGTSQLPNFMARLRSDLSLSSSWLGEKGADTACAPDPPGISALIASSAQDMKDVEEHDAAAMQPLMGALLLLGSNGGDRMRELRGHVEKRSGLKLASASWCDLHETLLRIY